MKSEARRSFRFIPHPSSLIPAVEVALIVAVFAVQAAWPAPDPNEPYYLGKAKHYWNHDWIPHDFFLESADSHWLFYFSLGWTARWLPLDALAWCGRLCTWTLLAWSWRRLSRTVAPQFGWAVFSAAIFLAANVGCQMAGEWVVGGFEAKGLAYALVFLALEALARGRWNAAWLLVGAASAFHVLVGGWSAAAIAWCWLNQGGERPKWSSMAPGLLGGLVVGIAGLYPVLALNYGADPQVIAEANEIYVFRRLHHHLLPQMFAWWMLLRFALLVAAWLVLCRSTPDDPRQRRLRGFVTGALAIALAGLLTAVATWHFRPLAAAALRLYWFRLADAAVPIGVALTAAARGQWLYRQDGSAPALHRAPPRRNGTRWVATCIAACALLAVSARGEYAAAKLFCAVPRADKPGKIVDYHDWREACAWIAANTPPDACFLTPRLAQTFKWHAARSEVVSWKDIPQDAAGIVEWWRRLRDLHGLYFLGSDDDWYDSLTERSPRRLERLGAKYRARYLLTEAEPELALERLHRNNSYTIYKLDW